MPATLYGHPVSQPARSCQWMIDFLGKGDEVPVKMTDFIAGENQTEEYVSKFPAKKVPAFETADGLCFGESLAILKYLSNKDDRFQPKCEKEEVLLNEYIGRHFSVVRAMTLDLFRPFFFLKGEERAQRIAAGYERVKPELQFFNDQLAKQNYILGDKLTLADFLFAPEVDQLAAVGEKYLAPYENITKYFERLRETAPGYKNSIDASLAAVSNALN